METLNLPDYIAANLESLAPPVCNKMIHNDGVLRIMIVGGPNQRKDYHLNLGEEIFYQIKGDMCLKIMECGEPKDIWIREGEFFVLPGRIAHSPQRLANTIGIVVERQRKEDELDGLRYYVDDTNQQTLWQRYFHVTNLGVQLVPLIQEFFASDAFTTRVPTEGDVQAPEGSWEPDAQLIVPVPFSLAGRFPELDAAPGRPPVRLGNREFVVDLISDNTQTPTLPLETEVWVWLLSGTATVVGVSKSSASPAALEEREFTLSKPGDSVLLHGGLVSLACGSRSEAREPLPEAENNNAAACDVVPTRLLVIYSTAF